MANGDRRFVLEMTELLYIDSAGLGELVKTFTAVSRAGGQLLIYYPRKGPEDLFVITKLATVFRFPNSVAELLPEFTEVSLPSRCVRCDYGVSVRPLQRYQTCARCGLEFRVRIPEDRPDALEVTLIRLKAYDQEHVSMWPNLRPLSIEIPGRLDLTAANLAAELSRLATSRCGRAITAATAGPRTPEGWRALGQLPGLTVFLRGFPQEEAPLVPRGVQVVDNPPSFSIATGSMMMPVLRPGEAFSAPVT
jgi:hypothetical protein